MPDLLAEASKRLGSLLLSGRGGEQGGDGGIGVDEEGGEVGGGGERGGKDGVVVGGDGGEEGAAVGEGEGAVVVCVDYIGELLRRNMFHCVKAILEELGKDDTE